MMRAARFAVLLLAALTLAACAGTRPDDAVCPAVTGVQPESFDVSLADAMAARWAAPRGTSDGHAAVLVLSGGGAWGAYGAGFLSGWTQRPKDNWPQRPTFDVVTGVSTGAIMAPFALLGPDYDRELQSAFRGVSGDNLFSSRNVLTLPWWNSLNDPKGLEEQLHGAFDDPTIAALRAAAQQRRTVWAGAVNFDTGEFTEFNLSALTRDLAPDQARDAITERILAASAVPAFFPPRFINGCMYMDGDVRENVFISKLHGAVKAAAGTPTPKADIYVVVNGTVGTHRVLTENSLLGIAVRGFEIAEGQIQLASLRDVYDYAQDHGYGFYWTSADDIVADPKDVHGRTDICPGPQTAADQFSAKFTACLYDAAQRKARDGRRPWRTDRP
ncbi:MAG TPA: patatin-like phospholipase family protein [Rhizomicrobium sp.]|jgi:predicted acylesterase/phospholipase RssA|nr:patatin-like phospholipase family protein [Rhizomicrobium sp.]